MGRGEQQQRRRQQEGQVGRAGEHVGPRRPVAAVTRVHLQIFLEVSIKYFLNLFSHLARCGAAHAVEEAQDVEHQDEQHGAAHTQAWG